MLSWHLANHTSVDGLTMPDEVLEYFGLIVHLLEEKASPDAKVRSAVDLQIRIPGPACWDLVPTSLCIAVGKILDDS